MDLESKCLYLQAAVLAAGPRPPAVPHPAEAGAAAGADETAGPASTADTDAEEPKVGDVVMGEVEVTDLVQIEDKPEQAKV